MEFQYFYEALARRHDRLSRDVERTTGLDTSNWFALLDQARAQRKGLPNTIGYLNRRYDLPHQLAAVLAWNYFNPSTLPCDLIRQIDPRYETDEVAVLHPGEVKPSNRATPRQRARQVAAHPRPQMKRAGARR